MTAPQLVPAPAELITLAHTTRPDLDPDQITALITGGLIAAPWAHLLRRVPWELADPQATVHDLRNAIYANAPGRAPRTTRTPTT